MILCNLNESIKNYSQTIDIVSDQGEFLQIGPDDFRKKIDKLTNIFDNSNIPAGSIISVHANNTIDFITLDIAATLRNLVLFCFPNESDQQYVISQSQKFGSCAIITDKKYEQSNPLVIEFSQLFNLTKIPASNQNVPTNKATDLHSMVYSSGTSGYQKGLNISKNGTEFVVKSFIDAYQINSYDSHIIFLPFSNYQQRLSLYGCILANCRIILSPFNRVFDSLKRYKPTFIIAPPMFYESIINIYKTLNNQSLASFLGGNIRFLITGMAPIKDSILKFYKDNNLSLLEAYGLTETGMVAWNTPESSRVGSVGQPLDRNHIIVSEDGELIIKRKYPLSFSYFQASDEDTKNTYTSEGIHTGDYGKFDVDGFLYLDGRKKDLIILPSGIKVHPAEIERYIYRKTGIQNVIATNDFSGDRILLIVPIKEASDEIKEKYKSMIMESNKDQDTYKRISRVLFTNIEIQSDKRFMTANFKLSRKTIHQHFVENIRSEHEVF